MVDHTCWGKWAGSSFLPAGPGPWGRLEVTHNSGVLSVIASPPAMSLQKARPPSKYYTSMPIPSHNCVCVVKHESTSGFMQD